MRIRIIVTALVVLLCGCSSVQRLDPDQGLVNVPIKTDFSEGDTDHLALIVSGYPRTETHVGWYDNALSKLYGVLTGKKGFERDEVYCLSANPVNLKDIADATSIKANLISSVKEISKRISKDGEVLIFLIGHGGGSSGSSFYELADSRLLDTELGGLIRKIDSGKLLTVVTSCRSGGFIDELSGKNRIAITSTGPNENNRAAFTEYLIEGLDKYPDVHGAYLHAKKRVAAHYGSREKKEHCLLDDNGDGKGSHAVKTDPREGEEGFFSKAFVVCED